MIFLALQSFCIYLTAELLVNTRTHMLLSVSVRDLRDLTVELLWASYRRAIAVAADTDRWLTVTQLREENSRGWESERVRGERKKNKMDRRVLPGFTVFLQRTAAQTHTQMPKISVRFFCDSVNHHLCAFMCDVLSVSWWHIVLIHINCFFYGDCFKNRVNRTTTEGQK